jgi:hypothetical protein
MQRGLGLLERRAGTIGDGFGVTERVLQLRATGLYGAQREEAPRGESGNTERPHQEAFHDGITIHTSCPAVPEDSQPLASALPLLSDTRRRDKTRYATATMPFASGSRLGPYEVLSLLGSGGMGEVYKARDTRLDRTIALKVLPELKASPDLRLRFTTEARAVASLNHPHICTLFDVGYEEGVDFLVEEYCDGATLADRLRKGPLTIDETLRYAIQMAEALEHAHGRGFVHRDLKPSNVALSSAGVKLLDFGLAQLARPEPAAQTVDTTTTSHEEDRVAGPIVGTRQYMAPEQLEGKAVDERADIFAFGAVVYEMLTGRKAFVADTPVSLIAAILTSDPPAISTLRPATPVALERLIRQCLAKNPHDRWWSMHDVLLQLRAVFDTRDVDRRVAPPPSRGRAALPWIIAAGALLAAAAVVWIAAVRRPGAASSALIRFPMPVPDTAVWSPLDAMTVSPDGRRFAFVASAGEDKPLLWVRLIDALSPQPLAGTEGASHPFWSPDSRFVGFFAGGKLKTIEVSGGAPQVVCDAPFGRTGTWGREGTILFARSARDPLYVVPAAGGLPAPATALDDRLGEWTHRAPQFLPDGRHFLYLARSTQPQHQML